HAVARGHFPFLEALAAPDADHRLAAGKAGGRHHDLLRHMVPDAVARAAFLHVAEAAEAAFGGVAMLRLEGLRAELDTVGLDLEPARLEAHIGLILGMAAHDIERLLLAHAELDPDDVGAGQI